MRWLLVFLLAFLIFNGLAAWLRKIGLGKLPGDFTLRLFGRIAHATSKPGKTHYYRAFTLIPRGENA